MKLDCPMDDCHASIEGETEADVMAQAEEHAKDAHPDLELDDATTADLKSKIQRT
jgi:predicted small metal-binding protein